MFITPLSSQSEVLLTKVEELEYDITNLNMF
jgi:hypothetical protein